MKPIQLKPLLLTIIFSILLFSKSYSQDLLDSVKNDSKLVIELKDLYKAFHINNILIGQKEMINLLRIDDSGDELRPLLNDYIKVCDSLKIVHVNNDTLRSYIDKYLTSTAASYKVAQTKGFSSSAFKKDFENYKKTTSEYMNYLYTTYSTSHFVNMTEEKYWQVNAKNNYIKSPDYATYKKLKATDLRSSLALLDNIAKQATDFQEYSIYQIELADQYVKHADSLGENSYDAAIEKYKAILDQEKYSIYLFEAWLKWRW